MACVLVACVLVACVLVACVLLQGGPDAHVMADFRLRLFFDYVPHGLYDAPADLEYMLSVGGCPCACAAASFRTLFANVLQSMLPATTLDAGVAESHL